VKCTNKHFIWICVFLISCLSLSGCSLFSNYDIPYDVNSNISAYSIQSGISSSDNLKSFAADLCVASDDVSLEKADLSLANSAILFNRSTKETLYSKQANIQLHPASTTKVMTALLALKYGTLDDILTASKNVEIKESGAQLCGFKEGDKATLEQVLNGLLIYSGNDAGVMIAEYVSGSEEAFAKLMNEEAKALGATNTNFVNPHGLTDESHLTTAYDLYLIFNEALKYDKFRNLINSKEYQSSYTNKDGGSKKMDFASTNRYLNGKAEAPSGVTVIGGKTGTTDAAGACLVLLSNGRNGDEYISVVMHSEDADSLYTNMTSLLSLEH